MTSTPKTHRTGPVLVAIALYWTVSSSLAHAQLGDVKLGAAGYEYFPAAAGRATPLNPGGGRAAFQMFRASVAVPLELSEHTYFIPGLRYSALDLMEDNPPPPETRQSIGALHALLLKAALWHAFDEHWAVFASVGGGLASDFSSGVSSRDWVVSAQLLGLWTIVRGFTLGAGVGYDRRTGSVSPLPLLALDWRPSDVFMVRGVVPESLAIRYRVIPWLTLALEGGLEGERYHLGAKKFGVDDAEVAYSIMKSGLSATVHWGDFVNTRLYGGAAFRRRFEFYVNDASQGDVRVAAGPFLGLEVSVGPSIWQKR